MPVDLIGPSELHHGARQSSRVSAVSLLEETLEEEKAADSKLTGIAESFVNEEAAAEASETDSGSESEEQEEQGEKKR